MSGDFSKDPMLDMFVFETMQLLERMEQILLDSEKTKGIISYIDEIFRIMHTIKGSASMMKFENIASLTHGAEDLFHFLREKKDLDIDYLKLTDILLESTDFIRKEIDKIEKGGKTASDAAKLIQDIYAFISSIKCSQPIQGQCDKTANKKKEEGIKNRYKALLFFEDGCEMENIRAFAVVHNLKRIACEIEFYPLDIQENPQSAEIIKRVGFKLIFAAELNIDEVRALLMDTLFLEKLELYPADMEAGEPEPMEEKQAAGSGTFDENSMEPEAEKEKNNSSVKRNQGFISVGINKLDMLMDLVGELVISQSMVTQNPELDGLKLSSFHKAARHMQKITDELQDIVMSIRMVALSPLFYKVNRIVRDMGKKLNKDIQLEIMGEDTEVDKNIIEHISDPLMHLIRNSIDHGIESPEERLSRGKPTEGRITLEAQNAGGDVWIIIRDDGRGLNKEKILNKALEHGLIKKNEIDHLTDKDIYSFVFKPGFSTSERITEFSGRGVGMDVVMKNVEKVKGTVSIDSTPGLGTTITIKIPLTLAIISGMVIKVGDSKYTIPIAAIKESFRAKEKDILIDPEGNEAIMLRGACHPVIRLHKIFCVDTETIPIHKGIIVMIESEQKSICLFADSLLGEHQVVVKALPQYIKKVRGIAGCTLLGDGSISLILDIAGFLESGQSWLNKVK